eukprot:2540265-Prymnesium_polylepis.1
MRMRNGPPKSAFLFVCVFLNAPLGHTPAHQPVAPLTVAALFIQRQFKLSQLDHAAPMVQAARALLVPAHAWEQAVRGNGVDSAAVLFDAALERAAKGGSWWAKAERQVVHAHLLCFVCPLAIPSPNAP